MTSRIFLKILSFYGRIGAVKISPSLWSGTIDVSVTNVELSFSFSATKAMRNAMRPAEAFFSSDLTQTTYIHVHQGWTAARAVF